MHSFKTISALLAIVFSLATVSCTKEADNMASSESGIRIYDQQQIALSEKIAVDADGLLWSIINRNGIVSSDGNKSINYIPEDGNPTSLSSRITNCIYADSNNNIWVGTQKGIDRLSEDRMTFHHYSYHGINNYIIGINEDPNGNLFAWSTGELLKYDKGQDSFVTLVHLPENNFRISSLTFDSLLGLWACYSSHVIHYGSSMDKMDEITLQGNISYITADDFGKVYIIHDGKVSILDAPSGKLIKEGCELVRQQLDGIRFTHKVSDYIIFLTRDNKVICYDTRRDVILNDEKGDIPFDMPDDISSISSLFSDHNGNLWGCGLSGRAFRIRPKDSKDPSGELSRNISRQRILCSTFDRDFIWTLTDQMELVTYSIQTGHVIRKDRVQNLFDSYNPSEQNNYTASITLCPDSRLILIAGENTGRFRILPDGSLEKDGRFSFEKEYVRLPEIVQDRSGAYWCAGFGPELWYSPSIGTSFRKIGQATDNPHVHATSMISLSSGGIACSFADTGVVITDPSDKSFKTISFPDQYDQIYISALHEDRYGTLWIASSDWGLFRIERQSEKMERISLFENIPVWDIGESDGQMYILAGDKLYRYDDKKDSFDIIWREKSGILSSYKLLCLPEGRVYIWDTDSYIDILSDEITEKTLLSSSVHAVLSSGNSVLWNAISRDEDTTMKVRLPKRPLSGASLHLSMPESESGNITFNCKINSKPSSGRTSVGGTVPADNLHYGRNRITFRAQNLARGLQAKEKTIIVSIPHPWYHPVIALIAAALAALAAFALIQRRRSLLQVEKERSEKELQMRINMDNIDFFANMSHEFRTPLTMISAAVDNMGTDAEDNQQNKMRQLIRRNTDRMLKLVSQILDFNKLDHDMLRLDVSLHDASVTISKVVDQFRFAATSKDITLKTDIPKEPLMMWIDQDKIEKVLYNLLSNAMKFTSSGGSIIVKAESIPSENMLKVSVSDTGIGIPEDSLETIFERFAQAQAHHKSTGTGIGLYFTKSLVELHHGSIFAENISSEEGKTGARFTFTLPMGEKSYTQDERNAVMQKDISVDSSSHQSEYIVGDKAASETSSKPKILVIDDDYDAVYLLKSLLSPKYNVISRFDAMSGYSIIEKEQPELIISDVMMLEVDGMQFCRMVKENINMCHIPVILLTAKSTVEDQITGLNCGADAYIVKPFNKDYLLAMVSSQIENRNRIRSIFGSVTKTRTVDQKEALSTMDRKLMDHIFSLMETSLKEGELNVDEISSQVGMSRTKFYSKIKALTGQTPNEFFNVYRLNRAAELLKEGKYKIAVIGEMVGFNSASHFSIVFKKHFGVLPSQFCSQEENATEEP